MQPDADQLRKEFVSRLGINVQRTEELADRLLDSLSAAEGGFPFFSDLPLRVRAESSDQVVGAARAIVANVVDARLHEGNHGALAEGGFGFPRSLEDHERAVRLEAETIGFFRAIGSTLDCLAAVLVGLLRVRESITRASFTSILRLNPDRATSEDQRLLWTELQEIVERQANDPRDWLDWTLAMRHALMHRARLLHVLVARETNLPDIALPAHVRQSLAVDRIRADHHFRRKPWLPDMQHLADGEISITDAILREPESVTLRGVMDATNRLAEACSQWLMDRWPVIEGNCSAPAAAWQSEQLRPIEFAGFAPESEMPELGAMIMSTRDAERIRLAAVVRDSPP